MAQDLALPNWLKLDGAIGDLGGLLPDVEALAQLAAEWKNIGHELFVLQHDAPVDDPLKLVAYLCGHADDPAVKTVFTKLGLDALQTKLAGLAKKISDPETPYGKLLRPMSAYAALTRGDPSDESDTTFGFNPTGPKDGELALKIPKLAAGGGTQLGPADITFNIKAGAGLECDAGAPWPFAEDGLHGSYLRIGAEATVSTKAGLSLPFGQWGQGTAHAGASGAAAISLFYQPSQPDDPMGSVLLRGLRRLPDPLDLRSLVDAMAVSGLGGIAIGCDGSVEAGLGLALGKSFNIPQVASGTVGLDASINFTRDARWIVSLHKGGDGLYHFALRRGDFSEREWAAGIGLKLDVSPLAKRVHDLLVEVDNFIGPNLKAITPFLSPGTYIAKELPGLLRTTAKSIIDDTQIRDAVVADLLTGLGGDAQQSSSVVDLLMDKIASNAGSVEKGILADLDQWTGHVVAKLVQQVPAFAADEAKAFLTSHIKPLLGDASKAFDAKLAELTGNAAISAALAKELSDLGTAVKSGEKQADKLLAGVRDVVGKYTNVMQEALKATADVINSKISAHFGWSGSDTSGHSAELGGTFSEANADTAQLWRDLVTGKLQKFQEIMTDPARCPAGLTLDTASRLSSFAAKERGTALEVVLFGVEISMRTIVRGEAKVSVNVAGDIAVKAAGTAEREGKGFDESQKVAFVSSLDLLQLKAQNMVGGRRNLGVSFKLDHTDKDLKVEEVDGLLKGLFDQGLIEQARLDNALAEYGRWKPILPQGKISGQIGIGFQLPAAAINTMIDIGRQLNAIDKNERRIAIGQVLEGTALVLVKAGAFRESTYLDELRLYRGEYELSQDAPASEILDSIDNDFKHQDKYRKEFPSLNQASRHGEDLVTILQQMARIYDAVPAAGDKPSAGEWGVDQYRDAEIAIAKAARNWLALNVVGLLIFTFRFRSRLTVVMLAFLRLLGAMSDPPKTGPLSQKLAAPIDTAKVSPLVRITMRRTDDDKQKAKDGEKSGQPSAEDRDLVKFV